MTRLRVAIVTTALAATAAAQGGTDLELIHVFGADRLLTPEFAEPRGWLDGSSYLVFEGERKPDAEGVEARPAAHFRVDARSGEREPLFPPGQDRAALAALPGLREERLDEALNDPEGYVWNADHTAYVLEVGNDMLLFDAKSGEARRLTETPGPEVGQQFSPDGRFVSFIHDYDLWVVETGGGTPRALTEGGNKDLLFGRLDWVYQEELYGRGNFQGYWWSPDSTRIALLKLDESPVTEFTIVSDVPTVPKVEHENYPKAGQGNPKAELGVVDVFGGETKWFDLSRFGATETLIVRVTWHPSGAEVFFQVTDREQTWLEMLAGNVETGEVRSVFKEESDCWVEPDPEPLWVEDGKSFLWLSERDGRKHVYWYETEGKLRARVTEGDWDVEEIEAVDEDGGLLYISTDRSDPKELHLWRVELTDSGDAKPLTARSGWHEVEMSPDRSLFLDEFSAIDYRRAWAVHTDDGEKVRAIVDSDMTPLAQFSLSQPEFHRVETRDGFVMEAMLIKPRGYEEGKRYPVLCHTYSGPHTPSVRNRWRWRDGLWHQLVAQKGYAVWICDNRSASGKGRRSARACYRDFGASELRDLEDGIKWLVDQGIADAERVGMWGWSYGGYQTLFNLTHSKVWKLGIAVNPVTDWSLYDTIYTERYMGMPQTNVQGYQRASVINSADKLHGDLLLIHATMDDNVHVQNSLQLVYALQQAGKQFRFMPYPRVRHGVENLRQQLHLFGLMTDFVVENL